MSAWGFALVLVACGGASQRSGEGTNQNGGGSSTQGGAPMTQPDAVCPPQLPVRGGACVQPLDCWFPSEEDADVCVPQPRATCVAGKWELSVQARVSDCGQMMPEPPSKCPATPATVGTPCGTAFLYCEYPNTHSSCPSVEGRACNDGLWGFAGPLVLCPGEPGYAGAGQGGGAGAAGAAGEGPAGGFGGEGGFGGAS